jgi:hypothetical protein
MWGLEVKIQKLKASEPGTWNLQLTRGNGNDQMRTITFFAIR